MSTKDKKTARLRLDRFLAGSGISPSPEKAKSKIIAGWVRINGETVRDPARNITGTEKIEVERPGGLYVSRGGEKLDRALELFGIKLDGLIVLDLGASTGGFTDCMLKRGAAKVYAVDVGYNQLDYSLRSDRRVVVMEKTHAGDIRGEMFSEAIDFFTADLSFISILKALPAVYEAFNRIEGVVLIKPQFEAEPDQHDKGVVRGGEQHVVILERVIRGMGNRGFNLCGLTYSPVKGPAGNIEFLAYIKKCSGSVSSVSEDFSHFQLEQLVDEAHKVLNR
jgi:23S rRNA (cytidine1920-2'-O)/16S rRNA (cytidine1409-2'-O)-methyltransferase